MGAPAGNVNGLTHGMRSSDDVMNVRFNLGKLPPMLKRIERAVNLFRRAIESAVVDAHGSVGVYHAALVQSAARLEARALMAQRWLRLNIEELDMNEKLACSKAIAEASTARDKCLERLGLHQTKGNAWDDLSVQLAIDESGDEPGDDKAAVPATTEPPTPTTKGTTDVHT